MYTFELNQLKGLILSLLHFSSIGNTSRSHWFLQILKLVLQVSLFFLLLSQFLLTEKIYDLFTLQSMKHHETEIFQEHLTCVSNVSLKKTAMSIFQLSQRTQWTGIIYSHNQHVTLNKIHMINM